MSIKHITKANLNDYQHICYILTPSSLQKLSATEDYLIPYLESDSFKFDGETILKLPFPNHLVSVLGLADESSEEEIFNAFGYIGKHLSENDSQQKILLHLETITSLIDAEDRFKTIIKGLTIGLYRYNIYKTDKKEVEFQIDLLSSSKDADLKLKQAKTITDAVTLARHLVDEPANHLKPKDLAKKVQKTFENTPVQVEIFNRDEIENLGLHLYLSVAKGSDAEPQLIVMNYIGDPESQNKIALIGKGMTYDSGGYSIKPTSSMLTMKSDMAGGAAVIGAMKIISEEQPKSNVVAVIAACENRISGSAYLPGDVITSLNGKTVEIDNTDAEGRLTLADAMTYAIRHKGASKVIDICTLTGACVVALGEEYAGVMTWEDELWSTLEKVSKKTLEPCWRLPLNKAIQKCNKGKIADLTNSGGRNAGSSVAGAFVGEFAEDKPWIHIDIAGTAYLSKAKPAFREGATGFGVHLLAELIKNL